MSHIALDHFRIHAPMPFAPSTWRWAVLAVGMASFWAAGSSRADDSPLVLTNEQIGLTRTEVEPPQTAAVDAAQFAPVSPAPEASGPADSIEPAWGSEFHSSESSPPAGCADATTAATAGAITSFDQCIEVSVRGGVGFKDASRVCEALFPGRG